MSRPSPQEQAEIDAASEPRDCRKCARCYDVLDGASVRCTSRDEMGDEAPVPWNIVTGMPCHTFQPLGASPQVSADREGPDASDVLEAMREAADDLDATQTGDTENPAVRRVEAALRRAITAEEARRARPSVEDPRDATIRDLRERLANVEPFEALHADLSEQIRAAWDAAGSGAKGMTTLADVIAADRQYAAEDRALLAKCAQLLDVMGRQHQILATDARDLLAALRAAGVEPKP